LRYVVAAVITAVALKGWSSYVDSVNLAMVPNWTSKQVVLGFIGPLSSRWQIKPWIMIGVYVGGFVATGPALLFAMGGLWSLLRRRVNDWLGAWLIAFAAFYLVWWRDGASAQSYYNLPALAPVSALFGMGVTALLNSKRLARWPRMGVAAAVLFFFCRCCPSGVTYSRRTPRSSPQRSGCGLTRRRGRSQFSAQIIAGT
jgi:hypothetical protein